MKKISKMKSSKLGSNSSATMQGPSILVNGKGKGGSGGQVSSTNGTSSLQDDANLKVLRDLCHVDPNRYCFECGQRGPTYVDVTIGSFVCMTCSGLLRGLTPPHRVKSISMASFTPDEMELLKTHGNEYCRKVWLATYTSKDTQLNSSDPDRMNALKALMSAKYEHKRYYVDPLKLSKSELSEIQGRNLKAVSGGEKSPASRPNRNASPLLNNVRSVNDGTKPRLTNSLTLPDIKPLSSLDSGLSSINADLSTLSLSSVSSNSSGTSSRHKGTSGTNPPPINFINNLLPNGNGAQSNSNSNYFQLSAWESVSDSEPNTNGVSTVDFNPNFADFDDAFNNAHQNGSGQNGFSNGFTQPPSSQPQLSQKLINGGFQPNSTSMQVPLVPNGDSAPSQNGFHSHPIGIGLSGNSAEDKYAALKDLDSLFKQHVDSGTPTLQPSTLSSSMSVPVNLTTSAINKDSVNGWFSAASPPNHNPFGKMNNGASGWATANNGFLNGCGLNANGSGQNPYNPFQVGNNAWGKGGDLSFHPLPTNSNGPSHQHFRTDEPVKAFNPFFQQQPPPLSSNPNNPFL